MRLAFEVTMSVYGRLQHDLMMAAPGVLWAVTVSTGDQWV